MTHAPLTDTDLAAIMERINEGALYLTRKLDEPSSNTVFNLLSPFPINLEDKVINTIARCLRATEIDLTCSMMTERKVQLVRTQKNLKSLSLGYFSKLEEYHLKKECRKDCEVYQRTEQNGNGENGDAGSSNGHEKKIAYIIDLPKLLKDMLQEESINLQSLDLSPEPTGTESNGHDEQFQDGWALLVGQMLPDLTNLSLRQRILTFEEFGHICIQFSQLETLDLTNTALESLEGISQLRNLKTLRIGCLKLISLDDLFNLENLRNLSFESTWWSCQCCRFGNGIDLYLESNRRMKSLVHLDLSMTTVTDKVVKRFVEEHPSLKSLGICGTKTQTIVYPNLQVYHCRTIQGAITSLDFYTAQKNSWMVDMVIDTLYDLLRQRLINRATNEELKAAMKTLNNTLEAYGHLKRVMRHGTYCYKEILKSTLLEVFDIADIQKMLHIQIANIVRHMKQLETYSPIYNEMVESWELLSNQDLLFQTPGLDFNKICFLGFRIVEITEAGDGIDLPHLEVLEILMDHIDKRAVVFRKTLKMKNVFAALRRIEELAESDSMVWRAAKNVGEFNFDIHFDL